VTELGIRNVILSLITFKFHEYEIMHKLHYQHNKFMKETFKVLLEHLFPIVTYIRVKQLLNTRKCRAGLNFVYQELIGLLDRCLLQLL